MTKKATEQKFTKLLDIVAKLRGPKGCPWDREQSHETLKPFMVEETYEAIEAIDEKDYKKLAEELGDQLLHVLMHAVMGAEKKRFDIDDIIDSITAKMIRRHPHVFPPSSQLRRDFGGRGGSKKIKTSNEVLEKWERIKQEEIKEKGEKHKSILESVPQALPALYRADKIQKRAARVGFDWDKVEGAWEKVHEEIDETFEVLNKKKGKTRLKEEIGDLLFAVVNVARKLNIDPEEALQKSSSKFIKRFKQVEEKAKKQGKVLHQMSLKEMDKLWEEAKRQKS